MVRGTILLTTINAKWIHPSLALRLLKANLGDLEGDCEILEFALRQPVAEKLEAIQDRRPGILGISVSIWNHSATLELLEALEREWAAAPGGSSPAGPVVVLGGPEVSYLPEDAEIFRHADYVIRGEGEDAFRELCRVLLNKREPAAGNKRNDEQNDEQDGRPPVRFINGSPADLARIRQAYHYYDNEDLSHKLVYVESSRGCPFRCGFCQSAAPAGFGSPAGPAAALRKFPLESFLVEMETLIRRGARNFKFLDRSFNADMGRALAIMDFFLRHIEAEAPADRPLCVHFEMVPDLFPPVLREKLRRFPPGTLRLEVGIQTLNPRVSSLINRPIGFAASFAGKAGGKTAGFGGGEAALEVLRFLSRETNARIHADLIAALPGEDIDSFAGGFDKLWLALGAEQGQPIRDMCFEIQPGILKLLPGTPLARLGGEWGIRCNPAPPYEALSTAALPRPDLDRIKNFARFWEVLVNRRPFPELPLVSPGRPVFWRFMDLSGRLLARFGRNWGIDRAELRAAVLEEE